jgi:hypothetical protein
MLPAVDRSHAEPEPEPEADDAWEMPFAAQLPLTALTMVLFVPIAASMLGLMTPLELSDRWRVVTGIVAAAVLALQLLVSVKKRTRLRLPGELLRWRALHQLNGLLVLAAIVVHTGGNLGTRLNAAILVVVAIAIGVTQAGHLLKSFLFERGGAGAPPLLQRLDHLANSRDGLLHLAGLGLHIVTTTLLIVLVVFHVLAVVYF